MRFIFIIILVITFSSLSFAQPIGDTIPIELDWYDVTEWGVEGRAWENEPRARWFDRLPASAESEVREKVWDLSRDSTGMMARSARAP